jgi:cathepsin F
MSYGTSGDAFSINEQENDDAVEVVDAKEPTITRFSSAVLKTILFSIGLVVVSIAAVSVNNSFISSSASTKASKFDLVVVERVTYATMSDDEQEALFVTFIEQYGRDYGSDSTSDEYQERLANFKTNLILADERNTAEALVGGEAIHGVTKFSDLTSDEFTENYLMSGYWTGTAIADHTRRLSEKKSGNTEGAKNSLRRGLQDVTVTNIDWSTSLLTPVQDQGSGCRGASWAFAGAEQIESDAIRKGIITTSDYLSAQQFISCVTNSSGCDSGSIESVYAYSKRPGAVFYATDYPYEESDANECADSGSGYALTLGSYATVTKYHNEIEGYSTEQVESNMLAHLVETGTLSACVDASTWNTYVSGTFFLTKR